jgi:hypothetical protein
MGDLKYPYLDITFETMRRNPKVDFVLIHVVENDSQLINENLLDKKPLNFRTWPISLRKMSLRIEKRLNININLTMDWYYKMCDFKPTLAYLFPEIIQQIPSYALKEHNIDVSTYESFHTTRIRVGKTRYSHKQIRQDLLHDRYKYWGYGDLDVIWGNISRFAYLFQGD